MSARTVFSALIVLAAGIGIGYFSAGKDSAVIAEIPAPIEERETVPAATTTEDFAPAVSAAPENAVTFMCAQGRTIIAVFARDIVGITLADERQFTLRETPTEAGIRYEDAYNGIVLTGDGETAYLMERGDVTHSSCRVEE